MILAWKTEVSVSHCPLRILHLFAWDQTHAFTIRSQCIATWATACLKSLLWK